MKPFNIEEAKAGKPVCTRNGSKVRIVCYDAKGHYPIVALVDNEESETLINCYRNGRFLVDEEDSAYDLMMASEKHEGWTNIYKYDNSTDYGLGTIYATKEDALSAKEGNISYVTTIKIEWEE